MSTNELERLGKTLAAAQDDVLAARALPPLEAPRRQVGWRLAPVAGLVAAGIAIMVVVSMRPRPVSAEVAGEPVVIGVWRETSATEELPVRFSEGSTVLMRPGGRMQLVATTPRGAHLRLERGTALVSVVHREDTTWQVEAGPYAVAVIGTRFSVSWDAVKEHFDLSLDEGTVRVTGPGLEPRTLVAGQRLQLGVKEAAAPAPRPDQPVARHPPMPPPSTPTPAPRAVKAPDWRRVAAEGRASEAIAEVERRGTESVLAGSSAAELLLLADTARLAGAPSLARTVLERVRGRFPSTPASAEAAFLLGRLALEVERTPASAIPFLRASLAEAPDGPLAREAMGRLLEALLATNDPHGARLVAQTYLDRFPGGPHAGTARRLVGP